MKRHPNVVGYKVFGVLAGAYKGGRERDAVTHAVGVDAKGEPVYEQGKTICRKIDLDRMCMDYDGYNADKDSPTCAICRERIR